MATTEDDLKRFVEFVHTRISADSAAELGLSELFDLWLLQAPSDDDYTENVAAVNASINDFLSGERGTPAGEHSRVLRDEFGIADE